MFNNIRYIQTRLPNNRGYKFIRIKIKKDNNLEDLLIETKKIEHHIPINLINNQHIVNGELEIKLDNDLSSFFAELDKRIAKDVSYYISEWCPVDKNDKFNYKALVRKLNDESYLKLKLTKKETKIYNEFDKEIDICILKEVPKFIQLKMEIYGICIHEKTISLIVKIHKISVYDNIIESEQERLYECIEMTNTD